MEISVGDDSGTEPIYVRQYSGTPLSSTSVTRQLTLLDASGNSTFPGTVTTGPILYVGTNDSSTTPKTIYFGGTYGDNAYDHCVIERRIWQTGTEKQELLLFSGNDVSGGSGSDRIRLKGNTILFDTYSTATSDRVAETTRMVLLQDGNFGIGTTTPGRKLHVNGDIYSSGQMYADGYVNANITARYYNASGANSTTTTTRAISVYADHHIRCSELQVTSDRRIKTDIVDVDDISALTLLRKIKPRTYGYVDKVHNGTGHVYGFIAQEIKELIPDAVDVSEGNLPNIYKHATIDIQANSITIKDFDTSTLNQTDSIIYIDQDDQRKTLKIKSIINSTQLEIDEDLEKLVETLKTSELEEHNFTGEIFIWGQKVQDFHHLKKSAIYTVATAALQEVDRQLQAEKARNDLLEARVLALENK
jgi:hypothetical protein